MIFGSFNEQNNLSESFVDQKNHLNEADKLEDSLQEGNFSVSLYSSGAIAHDFGHLLVKQEPKIAIAVYGNIYNYPELASKLSSVDRSTISAKSILLSGYHQYGVDLVKHLNGNFILVIYDGRKRCLWIARDRLGIESLYYYCDRGQLFFSSNLQKLAQINQINTGLNPTAFARYLIFNYNPGFDTFYKNINKLRPGHILKLENNNLDITPYWHLSFQNTFSKSLNTYKEELLELLQDAIRIRLDTDKFRTGAYLSGGMDSSSVVCLMRSLFEGSIDTFSFRCRGKSFDESAYARLISERYQTNHHEVPYEAEDVNRIFKVASLSPEPFSDIGIEVASLLLAEKASGVVDCVFTGDGGDELFAGHPVYIADRMASKFDRLPKFLGQSIVQICKQLPDTDQKKSLAVKAKRFSYSVGFPENLYSNRWRVYYTDRELQQLLHRDWYDCLRQTNPLDDIEQVYTEANGKDFLSKTIYGDYQTVVGFYLRRMEIVRSLGIQGRFPMFDHRLVEYAARIPSDLKIDRHGATKHIFHQVMAGVLPDEIVYRKDKLGHSVPFKNWLREIPAIKKLTKEYISPESIAQRGFFNPQYVERLYERHLQKADNNSHRLWSLLVFELWYRQNFEP